MMLEHPINTVRELRQFLGLSENDLVDTSNGLLDIFRVRNGFVSYGFLAEGNIREEPLDEFIDRFTIQEPSE